jgi:hypothetical protein
MKGAGIDGSILNYEGRREGEENAIALIYSIDVPPFFYRSALTI